MSIPPIYGAVPGNGGGGPGPTNPTPEPPSYMCSDWTAGDCGEPCSPEERHYYHTCTPARRDIESDCREDEVCQAQLPTCADYGLCGSKLARCEQVNLEGLTCYNCTCELNGYYSEPQPDMGCSEVTLCDDPCCGNGGICYECILTSSFSSSFIGFNGIPRTRNLFLHQVSRMVLYAVSVKDLNRFGGPLTILPAREDPIQGQRN